MTHCNSRYEWFISLSICSYLPVLKLYISLPWTLLGQCLFRSKWTFQQYSWVVYYYLQILLQLVFYSSDYSLQRVARSRCKVTFVIVLVYIVGMNGLLHVHIMVCIVGFLPFHITTEVICLYTVFPTSVWWIFTCHLALLWGVGHVIFLNVLHWNHQQTRWN